MILMTDLISSFASIHSYLSLILNAVRTSGLLALILGGHR